MFVAPMAGLSSLFVIAGLLLKDRFATIASSSSARACTAAPQAGWPHSCGGVSPEAAECWRRWSMSAGTVIRSAGSGWSRCSVEGSPASSEGWPARISFRRFPVGFTFVIFVS